MFFSYTLPLTLTVFASIVGFILLLRPILAPKGFRMMLVTIESVRAHISSKDISGDKAAQAFHDTTIDLALGYALIASGAAQTRKRRSELPEEVHGAVNYVEQEAWTWPYVASIVYRLRVAKFLGAPWIPSYWFPALISAVILSMFEQEDGGVNLAFARQESASMLEKEALRNASKVVCTASA